MKKNNKGFSLVELIVVIAIMAILAAVAVVSFSVYIQKAHDATDLEYQSNVEYAANLIATEHQFELKDVELEDVVDGPEDIKLIVYNPITGEDEYYTYETHPDIIQEIYDIVGDWTFSYACDHANCSKEELPATCLEPGYVKYSCGKEEILPINLDAHNWGEMEPTGVTGTYVSVCQNSIVTKDENGNDIHENCNKRGYFNEEGFPVASPFGSSNQDRGRYEKNTIYRCSIYTDLRSSDDCLCR